MKLYLIKHNYIDVEEIMNKILHQVWIQGESELPKAYTDNRNLWRENLPGWEMKLWDNETAQAQWSEYAEVEASCSHHAMRADLILARALRDFGGLATGTDVIPNNIPNLLKWLDVNSSLVIANPSSNSASNGLAYFEDIRHPFISCVCNHQLRDRNLLRNKNVWLITGPGCWYQALVDHRWNLSIATDLRAYTRLYSDKTVRNPDAWVDAGYAGSWHPKR